MKTNITKKETFKVLGTISAWPHTKEMTVSITDSLNDVEILIEANTSSVVLTLSPDAARKFANMIFAVANEVKDEWADMVLSKKKPLTKKKG